MFGINGAKGKYLWSFFILWLGFTGCSKPVPPGVVPPLNISSDKTAGKLDKVFSLFEKSELIFPRTEKVPSNRQTKTIKQFRQAYKERNRPRIAVFFNYRKKTSKGGLDSSKRIAFEEGFLKSFLAAGTVLVDRDMIVKITEVERGMDHQPDSPSLKLVMDALRDKADILIEVAAVEDYASPYGFNFKAASKAVTSGRFLAVSSSVGQGKDGKNPPDLGTLAYELAVDLMSGMTSSWNDKII